MVDDEDARELNRETRKHYDTTQELSDSIDELEERSDGIHAMVVERNSYIDQISNAISDTLNYLKGNRKELERNRDSIENSNEKLEEVQEKLSRRNFGKLVGYGLAAAGTGAALGGGALAHEELTEEEDIATVVPPKSYEVVYTEDLEEIAGEMEFSSNEIIATAGTDMEEILDRQPHTQHKIGFSEDDMYLDWGSNGRRYDLDDAYSEAKDIADSVVT
jgi:DNA repair exonuclease SbcCD ATPase subunit